MSATTTDPVLANNSASATTTVDPAADLSLTKTDSPDPVLAGQLLTYTLTVTNAGPSSATGVSVTDTLPAGVTFDSATPSQGTCSQSSGTVTCALGTIANGASATVAIKVRRSSRRHDHQPGDRVSRRPATRSWSTTPPAPTTTVDPAADLSLTKSDSPDPVLAGQLLTYTLERPNAGPQAPPA